MLLPVTLCSISGTLANQAGQRLMTESWSSANRADRSENSSHFASELNCDLTLHSAVRVVYVSKTIGATLDYLQIHIWQKRNSPTLLYLL